MTKKESPEHGHASSRQFPASASVNGYEREDLNSENRPIRVLHLIEHLRIGGAERVIVDLVKNLDSTKVTSMIFLYRDQGLLADELQDLGFPLIFFQKDYLTAQFPNVSRILLLPLFIWESAVFCIYLAGLIRKHRIQVIHSHMFSANLWGSICAMISTRPRIIMTEHTTFDTDTSLKRNILNHFLYKWCARVVGVTHEVARTIQQKHHLQPRKLVVIPNGIPLHDFENKSENPPVLLAQELQGTSPRIAAIGRLVEVKRFDVFIQAVSHCRNQGTELSAWLIGDGPKRAALEKLVSELHLQDTVFFLGQRQDVKQLLRHVDIVVNTSDREGLPISLLEAMAARVPVVATNAGGTSDLIQSEQNGILVEPGNPLAVGEAINRLISHPELAEHLGANGYEYVKKHYSLRSIIGMWENLYQEVLVEHSGTK